MLYTISQLRDEVLRQVYAVYEVFKNYFGEAFVDLQALPSNHDIAISSLLLNDTCNDREEYELDDRKLTALKEVFGNKEVFILVYWPSITVTNENDKSITIQDLFAKVIINYNGFIPTTSTGFLLNRATYTKDQWYSGYMHSHISHISIHSPDCFMNPCLGTGPINNTITGLREDISEGFSEINWMLFCEELSRYVTVESLSGVPYKRLENVGYGRLHSDYQGYVGNPSIQIWTSVLEKSKLKEFILYYLEHGNLSMNYSNGNFVLGMSCLDYAVDVSNAFIDYFNTSFNDKALAEKCFSFGLIKKALISDGKILKCTPYNRNNQEDDISSAIGTPICTFKGRTVTLNILDTEDTLTETILLNNEILSFILINILKVVNYRYGNKQDNTLNTNSSQELCVATSDKKVYYL